MNLCTCFVLFKIFAITNSITRIRPKKDHGIIRPSNEDFGATTKNLDNAHSFLATVVDGTDNLQLVFAAPKVETFTDFIQETVDILNTYEDAAFKDFFHILDTEIRKYHYKGCRFSELMQNHNTRSLLSAALTTVRENSVTFTKANINEIADMLRDEIYDENVKELLNYINSLYKNYEPKFRRIINNLNNFTKVKSTKTHDDLVQIVGDGVRTILFNHYTELDTQTRRELKEKIETFWEKYKKNTASNDGTNSASNRNRVSNPVINNIHVFKTAEDKRKEHKLGYNSDPKKFLRKRKKIVSKEANVDQSKYEYESSFESGSLTTDDSAEGFSSEQSLDSSNSIKHSQERHKVYNTQRYMTLYTEEMSYKARTTTKTEIPIDEKLLTTPKVHRVLMTTPRYRPRNLSSDRKKKIEKLRMNHDTDGVERDSFSDEHRHAAGTTAVLRSQYEAVIDVQLSNRDMLKSLKKLVPVGTTEKDDTERDVESEPVSKEIIIPHPIMRTQNGTLISKLNATTATRQSKRKESNEKKTKDPKFKTFNDYVDKKISSFEKELTKLKQMTYKKTSVTKKHKNRVKIHVIDDNEMKRKKIEVNRLMRDDYNLIDKHISENKTVKTKSITITPISSTLKVVKHEIDNKAHSAKTVNKSISHANRTNFQIDTDDLSSEFIRNNKTTSKSAVTIPTAKTTTIIKADSKKKDERLFTKSLMIK